MVMVEMTLSIPDQFKELLEENRELLEENKRLQERINFLLITEPAEWPMEVMKWIKS